MTVRYIGRIAPASLAMLILLAPAKAAAQAGSGIEGGVNVANVSFDATGDASDLNALSFKTRTGGVGGFFFSYDFNPNAGLKIDILYSQKGTKVSGPVEFFNGDTLEVSVDYIEIPVLLRANFTASPTVKFHVFGGPSFAFKVRDKTTVGGTEVTGSDAFQAKSYDVGIAAGAAVQFGGFFIDGRYTWGLINIDDDPTDAGMVTVKTRATTVMVGFAF